MSHITKIDTVPVRDINALRQAVAELNQQGVKCTLVEKTKPRVHGADTVPVCDYVVKLPGAYDVGFKKNAEGIYEPVLDIYGSHVGAHLGADTKYCPVPSDRQGKAKHQIGKMMQLYTKHAAINAAKAQGHRVKSVKTTADGKLVLNIAV